MVLEHKPQPAAGRLAARFSDLPLLKHCRTVTRLFKRRAAGRRLHPTGWFRACCGRRPAQHHASTMRFCTECRWHQRQQARYPSCHLAPFDFPFRQPNHSVQFRNTPVRSSLCTRGPARILPPPTRPRRPGPSRSPCPHCCVPLRFMMQLKRTRRMSVRRRRAGSLLLVSAFVQLMLLLGGAGACNS